MNREEVAFRESPFSIVASPSTAGCWAGQQAVLRQIRRLRRSWTSRADSSLDLMWSNLGAGKSHALFHLKYLINSDKDSPPTNVVLIELPEDLKRFIDLYRKIVIALPVEKIAELSHTTRSIAPGSPLGRAFQAIKNGALPQQELAVQWIQGVRVGLHELKANTGIDHRIERDTEAQEVLTSLIRVLSGNGRRLVLMVDEFQRIGHLQSRYRDEILAHVRSIFSSSPSYFSMVLAAGTRMESSALGLLPGELKTLMGMKPAISLPEMSSDEALAFIKERFKWFRPEGYTESDEYPFQPGQIEYIISFVVQREAKLTPRTLLQVLGIVYDNLLDSEETLSIAEIALLLESLRWDDLKEPAN